MAKIKDLNSKLKSVKTLLKMKQSQEASKKSPDDSSFFETSNLLSPVQETDFWTDRFESNKPRFQTEKSKRKMDNIKIFGNQESKSKSLKAEHHNDLVKIWKQIKTVDDCVSSLFNTFQKVSKGKEKDLDDLLNFENKAEYSNIEEEIDAFLSEANEEEDVSVHSIIGFLKKIKENIMKLLNKSTDLYLDQWSKEWIVQ